jgi:hypothetical protein
MDPFERGGIQDFDFIMAGEQDHRNGFFGTGSEKSLM